ncbi:preprotein translocase subunit SecE [Corynebacterium phocae]|uniref:Protein translocase subunit SecE n=1 Tax=Corynebacterium phocae TaxID=161895 RepID=A0A1L7D164_9CORY|nr:preprotein translocase subunit SecE [Corynebacterium phocae]APT91879.1 preprotein translocase subunit SecE [Corynebacterium phocae]KAA8727424.1 preprotein translocase subunit SecE [Corynebacterium phocae]
MSDEQQPSGAPRPTGKRQLTGATTTSSAAYEDKRVVRVEAGEEPAGSQDGPGGGVAAFPGEVASEMKKVVWPTGKEMVQYTIVTFMFLLILTALVWSVDTLTGLGIEAILVP